MWAELESFARIFESQATKDDCQEKRASIEAFGKTMEKLDIKSGVWIQLCGKMYTWRRNWGEPYKIFSEGISDEN